MPPENISRLNPLIHSRIRLSVLSILVTAKEADFSYLRETIGTTDGNLSSHLSKLEQAKYIRIKKFFKGKRPRTTCAITEAGRHAFSEYLKVLEDIVRRHS